MTTEKKEVCAVCGEETRHPPYCIECDMSGRSRAHLEKAKAAPPLPGEVER